MEDGQRWVLVCKRDDDTNAVTSADGHEGFKQLMDVAKRYVLNYIGEPKPELVGLYLVMELGEWGGANFITPERTAPWAKVAARKRAKAQAPPA